MNHSSGRPRACGDTAPDQRIGSVGRQLEIADRSRLCQRSTLENDDFAVFVGRPLNIDGGFEVAFQLDRNIGDRKDLDVREGSVSPLVSPFPWKTRRRFGIGFTPKSTIKLSSADEPLITSPGLWQTGVR